MFNDVGHLYKRYLFKDFMEPMTFANKVAEVAEKAAHHPDLKIDWGECAIEIWADLLYEILEKFLMGSVNKFV